VERSNLAFYNLVIYGEIVTPLAGTRNDRTERGLRFPNRDSVFFMDLRIRGRDVTIAFRSVLSGSTWLSMAPSAKFQIHVETTDRVYPVHHYICEEQQEYFLFCFSEGFALPPSQEVPAKSFLSPHLL